MDLRRTIHKGVVCGVMPVRKAIAILLGGDNDLKSAAVVEHRLREPCVGAIGDARYAYKVLATVTADNFLDLRLYKDGRLVRQSAVPGNSHAHVVSSWSQIYAVQPRAGWSLSVGPP
jgi:hypothetical protein